MERKFKGINKVLRDIKAAGRTGLQVEVWYSPERDEVWGKVLTQNSWTAYDIENPNLRLGAFADATMSRKLLKKMLTNAITNLMAVIGE